MSRSNRRGMFNQIIEHVEITDVAAEGKSIARYQDMVIFVNYGAPGDVVDIQIRKTRKRHMEGEIIRFHNQSDQRTAPFCEHFGTCGGCKWQHLDYNSQIQYKQKQVSDSLQRIGKVNYPYEMIPVKGSEKTVFYRNKLEFTFSDKRWLERSEIEKEQQILNLNALGFHIPGFFDKVLDIKKCWLQPEPSNRIRLRVKELSEKHQLPFYDFRKREGFLRNLIIRNNVRGEFMVVLVVNEEKKGWIRLILDDLKEQYREIKSLHYIVNSKMNDSISDLQAVHYSGQAFIEEQIEGLVFETGPKSFYQTNSQQAYELYKIVRDFAGLSGREVVYDLYTGAGTIAAFVSGKAGRVVGVEYVEEAINSALKNAEKNGQNNLTFVCGDMAKIFNQSFMDEHGKPDVVITDPPRAGMHPAVTATLSRSAAQKIVYVSCNPATQARDIEILSPFYKVIKAQAVDMFPHTQHVESVVLLEKRKDEL
ncbi:MAG: 23S rRNA (uracil(1939)-C(5))-methyltransferase RlmD [Bacteroidota bacterium]